MVTMATSAASTAEEDLDLMTTEEIRSKSSEWNLACDAALRRRLEATAKNLRDQTDQITRDLDSLRGRADESAAKLGDVTNRFHLLANIQFIESRVYDDHDEVVEAATKSDNVGKSNEEKEAEFFSSVSSALNAGAQFVEKAFDRVEFEHSDTEDEEVSEELEPVYESRNVYHLRRLPCVIGTQSFLNDKYVGLAHSSDETEDISKDSDEEESLDGDDLNNKPLKTKDDDSIYSLSDQDTEDTDRVVRQMSAKKGLFASDDDEDEGLFGSSSARDPTGDDDTSTIEEVKPKSFVNELSSKIIKKKKKKKSLFGSEGSSASEDDSLFSSKTSVSNQSGPPPTTNNKASETKPKSDDKKSSLFDDEGDAAAAAEDIFKTNQDKKTPVNLFGDDENSDADEEQHQNDLFESKSRRRVEQKRNLFDDSSDDEDFEDLFAKKKTTTTDTKVLVHSTSPDLKAERQPKKKTSLFSESSQDEENDDDNDLFATQKDENVEAKKKPPVGGVPMFGAFKVPIKPKTEDVVPSNDPLSDDDDDEDLLFIPVPSSKSIKETEKTVSSLFDHPSSPGDDLFAAKKPDQPKSQLGNVDSVKSSDTIEASKSPTSDFDQGKKSEEGAKPKIKQSSLLVVGPVDLIKPDESSSNLKSEPSKTEHKQSLIGETKPSENSITNNKTLLGDGAVMPKSPNPEQALESKGAKPKQHGKKKASLFSDSSDDDDLESLFTKKKTAPTKMLESSVNEPLLGDDVDGNIASRQAKKSFKDVLASKLAKKPSSSPPPRQPKDDENLSPLAEDHQSTQSQVKNESNLLVGVTKSRARIGAKRRPQSRQQRLANLAQTSSTINDDFVDESDAAISPNKKSASVPPIKQAEPVNIKTSKAPVNMVSNTKGPKKAEPVNMAPNANVPKEAKPVNMAPNANVPKEAKPVNMAPNANVPKEAKPVNMAPNANVPKEAKPVNMAPNTTVPKEAKPVNMAPNTTLPKEAKPVNMAPSRKVPKEAEPVNRAPNTKAPKEAEPVKTSNKDDPVNLVPQEAKPVNMAPNTKVLREAEPVKTPSEDEPFNTKESDRDNAIEDEDDDGLFGPPPMPDEISNSGKDKSNISDPLFGTASSDEDDLFSSATSSKPVTKSTIHQASLFDDDDDDDDDLFTAMAKQKTSKKVSTKIAAAPRVEEDDLFSNKT